MTLLNHDSNVIELKAFRPPPESGIKLYVHCKQCFQEMPTYQQDLEIGWTEKGLQVWCRWHDMNVMHLDFEGRKVKSI